MKNRLIHSALNYSIREDKKTTKLKFTQHEFDKATNQNYVINNYWLYLESTVVLNIRYYRNATIKPCSIYLHFFPELDQILTLNAIYRFFSKSQILLMYDNIQMAEVLKTYLISHIFSFNFQFIASFLFFW